MAPQGDIPVAANVLGTIGTVFWCIQLIPQIWFNWKQKKTDGLPGLMMFLWAILIYNNAWRVWTASLLAAGIGALFGGIQLLLVLTLRGPYSRGVEWPMTVVGVMTAILLASGLIPPYFEIAKRSGRVVGINFVFLSIDWLGAFFSLMALVAQHTFDVIGGVQYLVCLLLEAGIFTSHLLFLLRTRSLRRRAKESSTPFDDMPEARKFVFPRPDESTSLQPTSGEAELADVEKGGVDGTAEMVNVQEEVERKKSCESAEGGKRRGSTVAVGRWPSRQ
ncbi:MAG: hypothetical protein L6R42_005275 [Xanthoria sp. 1 TBL-2021]|nr:MAG: hypothetical protein L6R42_005275 [Xanthoria sp. 1 TBL-2021]